MAAPSATTGGASLHGTYRADRERYPGGQVRGQPQSDGQAARQDRLARNRKRSPVHR